MTCSQAVVFDDLREAQDVVERCLIHWFPDAPPSQRCDVARSILAALSVANPRIEHGPELP